MSHSYWRGGLEALSMRNFITSSEAVATYGTDWSWYRIGMVMVPADLWYFFRIYKYTMYVYTHAKNKRFEYMFIFLTPQGYPPRDSALRFSLTCDSQGYGQSFPSINAEAKQTNPYRLITLGMPNPSQKVTNLQSWSSLSFWNLSEKSMEIFRHPGGSCWAILASWVGQLFSSRVWLSKMWAKADECRQHWVGVVFVWFHRLKTFWSLKFWIFCSDGISLHISLDSLDSTWGTFASKSVANSSGNTFRFLIVFRLLGLKMSV